MYTGLRGFQVPDPTAQFNDPKAWVTTGTPTGGSDPKTVEMLAKIKELVAAYGATRINTVGPAYANHLLLPDGTVTADLSIAQFEVPWMADAYAAALASKRYLILYWGPRMPISTIYATTEPLAGAVHDAVVAGSVAAGTPGKMVGTTPEIAAAEQAITQAATTTQPTVPVPSQILYPASVQTPVQTMTPTRGGGDLAPPVLDFAAGGSSSSGGNGVTTGGVSMGTLLLVGGAAFLLLAGRKKRRR